MIDVNSASGVGLTVRTMLGTAAVALVSVETAEDWLDRVLGAVDAPLDAATLDGDRDVAAGARYAAGMSIQLVELWNVPRVRSKSMGVELRDFDTINIVGVAGCHPVQVLV